VFLKYYPLALVLVLLVAQLRPNGTPLKERLLAMRRPVGAFVAACVGLLALTVLINPVVFYRQLSTLSQRPLEVESVPASLVWAGTRLGFPMRAFVGFGSDNVASPLAAPAALLVAVLAVVAVATLLSGVWFRRMTLGQAFLATLLAVTIAGKVFSAQYLIWLVPIAALVVPLEGLMPLAWLAACALTTFGFPFLFRAQHGGWHGVVALRNVLIVALAAGVLPLEEWARWWQAARSARRPAWLGLPAKLRERRATHGEPSGSPAET
ncbi:MAG: hypothetical protein ACHQ4H_11320, partial [Ktedonobacterales bacterium]